jgi:transposase
MMRTGWFKTVHVKSEASYRLRLLISNRRNLKRKFLDLENAVRHSLKAFGVKVSAQCGRMGFDAKVREMVAHDPVLLGLCDAMLTSQWRCALRSSRRGDKFDTFVAREDRIYRPKLLYGNF